MVIDYRSSFAVNTSAKDGEEQNTCRTQLLARCALTHASSGRAEQFFLGKECIGEYMYQARGIAQVPTSEVCIIFSEGDSSLLKKFANHDNDVVQPGEMTVPRKGFDGSYANWTSLNFILKEAAAQPLQTADEIVAATLNGDPLVGRTTLDDKEGGWRAVLEYPIPYMNVHPPQNLFQVDVGPILYPDFTATTPSLVERLQLAYVMYNRLDVAEFALRVPTQVAEGQTATTLHYSEVVEETAPSVLYRLESE
tara:strand:- start:719 stop:1474 length:756 start_codon:yes stop_codon:yes gene_type:complete